mgnify:CR=1 FL=1
MAQNSFWSDASRGGAIIGVAGGLVFSLLGMAIPSISFITSLANFVITIYLLFYFTRRRAMLYPAEEGFTYSQSLGFIVAMAIFAGIIAGAYQIVASNFLFKEMFEETFNTSIATLKQTGLYTNEMMDQMSKLMRSYIFSPIPALISNIFGNMLTFGFYGLFISIGTKCEPNIFDSNYEEEEDE